jgi:hypothetical protein
MAAHSGRVFYHDKTLWISPTHNQGFKPTPMEMVELWDDRAVGVEPNTGVQLNKSRVFDREA